MTDAKQQGTDRPQLFVTGNVQAAGIVQVLKNVRPVAARFDVTYVDQASALPKSAPKGSVLLEQVGEGGKGLTTLPAGIAKRVRFPDLTFALLWPFNSVNPYNKPQPPEFPYGRFPNGDSFIQSCLAANVPRNDILRLYFGNEWSASWPDLDALFKKTSARLTAMDATFELGIGSYILKHFRRQRLFLTPQSPTDLLLAELITRLLAAAFPKDAEMASANAPGVIASLGSRDCLGIFAIPIHPLVARHFELTWVSPHTRYNYFDREQLTVREYCARFLDDAYANGAGQKAEPARISSR